MVCTAALLLSGAVLGSDRTAIRLGVTYGEHFGDTRFESAWPFIDTSGALVTGGSELIFPLDFSTVGFEFGFIRQKQGEVYWTLTARVDLAVNDPGDKMIDRDWFDVGGLEDEFSWTESTVDGSWRALEVKATRTLIRDTRWDLAVVAGVGYQKTKQRLIDLAGWQINQSTGVRFDFDLDTLAGTYEVSYFRPMLGVRPRLKVGSRATIEIEGLVSPLLRAKEIDDHVLRKFQIRADGQGSGYSGRVGLVYRLTNGERSNLFLRLEAEVSRSTVRVEGWREYYADGEGGLIEAGSLWPEAHDLSSDQSALRLTFEARL
jgi:hypothetical protein